MIKICLKQLVPLFGGILLLFASTITHANTADSLKRLYEMRLLTFSVLGDYYMFSGLEGDTRYNREIESGVKRFEAHLAALTQGGRAVGKLASLAKAIDAWNQFKELLDTNRSDFLVRGYADARLVSDLSVNAVNLSQQLSMTYTELKSAQNYEVSEWTQHCRDMGLIIQTVTAEYAAHTTSSLGQVARIQINEGGMESQADVFNQSLDKLKKAPSATKQIAKLMDQVGIKWEFIAKSVRNYNENAVPFIVSTYGDRISKSLDEIATHYEGLQQAQGN